MRRLAALAGMVALAACATGAGTAGAPLALPPCPSSPNCVSSLASGLVHGTDPFLVRGDPEVAWRAVERTVAAMPRTRVVGFDAHTLRAEATSERMHYVDDLVLVRSSDGRRIDVRSASRVGWWDLGVNRGRVASLRRALRDAGAIE